MTRVEWYLARPLRAKSLPPPGRGQEDHGGKPARILWRVLARGSDGCIPVSSLRAPCLTFLHAGLARVWDSPLSRLARQPCNPGPSAVSVCPRWSQLAGISAFTAAAGAVAALAGNGVGRLRSWPIWRTSTAMARTNVPCPHEQLIGLLEGMFVGDEVLLDVSFTAARVRLADLLRGGLLLSASEDAYSQGITGLVRVGPAGLSRLVQVQTRELAERDGCAGLAIRWEVTGLGGGLFPVLDADIMLAPAGPRSTLLTLSGAYRPPLGSVGEAPDRVVLHRVAAATIRSFISRLAAGITGHPGPAGTRAADGVPSPLPPAPGLP